MESDLKLPPGFRFHPTDEELVMHYLVKKCASQQIEVPIVAEIDLYKYNPWELPDMAVYGEKEWYFFSPRERKYPNGSRPNRGAGSGYWKATGADKPISQPKVVGIKKSLVFYAGKAPRGEKSDWIMHEYRLANVDRSARNHRNDSRLDEWVLCRIYNKKGTVGRKKTGSVLSAIQEKEKKPDVTMSSFPMPAIHEQQVEEQDVFNDDLMRFDTSDSDPKPHTYSSSYSSSSDHAVSPQEVTAEVHSQPKVFGEDFDKRDLYFPFNYMAYPQGGATVGNAGFSMNDRFEGSNYQASSLQEMLMGMLPY